MWGSFEFCFFSYTLVNPILENNRVNMRNNAFEIWSEHNFMKKNKKIFCRPKYWIMLSNLRKCIWMWRYIWQDHSVYCTKFVWFYDVFGLGLHDYVLWFSIYGGYLSRLLTPPGTPLFSLKMESQTTATSQLEIPATRPTALRSRVRDF